MLEFSKESHSNAFQNERTLEAFFKTLIRNLYIKHDELHIKEL